MAWTPQGQLHRAVAAADSATCPVDEMEFPVASNHCRDDDDVDEYAWYWGSDTDDDGGDVGVSAPVFSNGSERHGKAMFRRYLRGT